MNELADFNTYARGFGTRMFLVAGRVYDLAPDKWEWLACAWYERHGLLELPGDRYIGKLPGSDQEAVRYASVDALLLNPPKELVGIGQHIYDGWLAKKAQLDKIRNVDPIIILPPPPEPPKPTKPTKPVPVELPPQEPAPKKQRPEWQIKTGVWLTVLTPIAALGTMLLPPPWSIVGKALYEALKLLIGG